MLVNISVKLKTFLLKLIDQKSAFLRQLLFILSIILTYTFNLILQFYIKIFNK